MSLSVRASSDWQVEGAYKVREGWQNEKERAEWQEELAGGRYGAYYTAGS